MESNVLTKPLFVVSDLHLGDKGSRDNFHAKIKTLAGEIDREAEFMSFLNLVKNNNGALAILGDMFEFWQSNIGTVIARNKKLLDALSEMDITVILGNHDSDIFELIQDKELCPRHPFFSKVFSPEDYITPIPEKNINVLRIKAVQSDSTYPLKIGLMHGHEIDVYNMNATPGIGRMATIFAGVIEDSYGNPYSTDGKLVEAALFDSINEIKACSELLGGYLISAVKGIANKILPGLFNMTNETVLSVMNQEMIAARYNKEEKEKIRKSLEELRIRETSTSESESLVLKERFDVLVTGHTHDDTLGSTYCNSGSWITNKPSFLVIQPNGDIGLYRWCAESNNDEKAVIRGMRKATGDIILYEPFDIYTGKWKTKFSNMAYRADGVLASELENMQ